MYKVQVLLSAYNGEKYIKEQLDSILNQQKVQVSVLVRDDGSTDGTIHILKDYCNKYTNIKLIEGHNIGVVRSFFELFKNADKDMDLYALSDQDDVWDEDKLIIACEAICKNINSSSKPAMYCCEADITDVSLHISKSKANHKKKNTTLIKPGFSNALIENIARGGSVVFNQSLLNMLQIDFPEGCYMHDWWLYLVASCYGKVIYDSTPHYKYRQHSGNVLGATTSKLGVIKRRLHQSKTNKGHVSIQAKAFNKAYDIPEKKLVPLMVLTDYKASLKQRARGISGKYLYRQNQTDNLIFRLLFFTNHL